MQFKVPQFIDVEDKLFGPLTFKQFAYLAGGGGIIFVIYTIMPLWMGIIPMALVAILSLALAFYKINNQPFIYYLQASISYFLKSKLYIWKQRPPKKTDTVSEEESLKPVQVVPSVSGSKLSEISWNLDVKDER